MCSECNTNPKIDKSLLDPNRGVRLTYDITLPAALYDIPFPEFTDAVDRALQDMRVAIYNRAKESYIERATHQAINALTISDTDPRASGKVD